MSEGNVVVPFGRYKGRPIQETLHDKEYWEYMATQHWFREKFVTIYNITNSIHESEDTPEHNRIQIMFDDQKFIIAFMEKIIGREKAAWHGDGDYRPEYEVRLRIDGGYGRPSHGPPVDVCIGGIGIEIKPSVGDDYPAILRQMRANGATVLLTEKYIGTGADLDQVRRFFTTASKRVVLLEEVAELM